jgi:hypothetical protein
MQRLRSLISRRRKKRDRQLQPERLEARQLLFGTPLGQFVDAAYQDVLERRAEAGGLEFWSGLLGTNAISRADVARSILNSAEYTRGEISDLYTELLGRPADAGVLNFWAAAELARRASGVLGLP